MWRLDPFPHGVFVDLFPRDLLKQVRAEIPPPNVDGWRRYGNDRELKLEGPPTLWGDATVRYFDELAARADWLADLSGIPHLSMETVGGGYHLIPPGGYLDVHTDFSRSPQSGLYRRLNVLTYLNVGWDDDGGQLELWNDDGPAVAVAPEMGTTVIFATSATSWHGHPRPASRWRASVAAYFFSPDEPPGFREQSTEWHPVGGRRA